MELNRIPSHDRNPLASLATAQISVKAIPKASQQHFPLMKLLPELRIRIYECVFSDLVDTLTPPWAEAGEQESTVTLLEMSSIP